MKTFIQNLCVAATLFASATVFADVLTDIKPLQDRWAEVNYTLSEDDREKAFAELLSNADQVVSSNPDKAEALIWRGIIKSSYANAKAA